MDVEATDEDGNPLRGLTADDFTLKINGRRREIYSVDDLCGCAAGEPIDTSAGPTPPMDEPPDSGRAAARPPSSEPMLWVLYLNFGQLAQDGRAHALAEARRWLREVKRPDDPVQILAWASQAGLRRLTPVTTDRARLLRAIDEAEGDPLLNDPLPALREIRRKELALCFRGCGDSCTICTMNATDYARQEASQGRRSHEALQRALYRLEGVPGSKTLLYFYQNDTLYPARVFLGARRDLVGDQIGELDRTAADATLSRTRIVAAYSGSDPVDASINFGANVALLTGGDYGRAAHLLASITDEAGRGCRCVYRIATRPPAGGRRDVYRASIRVRDQTRARPYCVQHLTQLERWVRDARAVLENPETADAIPVFAALVPVGLRNGRWSVSVDVALGADSLVVPGAAGPRGSWETGALVSRDNGREATEFLARSRLQVNEVADADGTIVHRTTLEELKPGTWRLAAFVRDRISSVFGGSEAELTLPDPTRAGVTTPIPFRAAGAWIATELPRFSKHALENARPGTVEEGSLPLAGRPVVRGEPLEMRSWVCRSRKGAPGMLQRFLSRDDQPLFRFEATDTPHRGTCKRIVDEVDTRFLDRGTYVYRVRYRLDETEDPIEVSAEFTVTD